MGCLRVKGFISMIHREFSGLNCGKLIIMHVLVAVSVCRGCGLVSGTKVFSHRIRFKLCLCWKSSSVASRVAAMDGRRSEGHQSGKEATRFSQSEGLRDSSRLIVIIHKNGTRGKGEGRSGQKHRICQSVVLSGIGVMKYSPSC